MARYDADSPTLMCSATHAGAFDGSGGRGSIVVADGRVVLVDVVEDVAPVVVGAAVVGVTKAVEAGDEEGVASPASTVGGGEDVVRRGRVARARRQPAIRPTTM